ncbi:ATP-dependent DNA helicase RecG [Motilibacter aurantiacus]|uniref:ATP-dependent DNA helicase RecG n=1 Tax=Motilibacter aurantiacus TaxID=2714955 RepID=UPI001407B89D|nr:ATP-dependent DNA helicase RecG [Motilibacter aurantiacus]
MLDDPLKSLVGDRTAAVLEKGLGLRTVGELLRHYPRRYAERGQLTDLRGLEPDEHVTVMARVERVSSRQFSRGGRRGSLLEVVVTDGVGRLKLTFFNQHWREKELREGRTGLFSGKVGDFRGQRQLAHPDYVLLDGNADLEAGADDIAAFAEALIPVYPATAQLPSWKIAQCVRVALDSLRDPPDPLPEAVLVGEGLVPLGEAFRLVHRPQTRGDVTRALQRLRWDEAFVLQVALAQRRAAVRALPAVARAGSPDGVLAAFDAALPFTLTEGQQAVGEELRADLARAYPMNRLLQGEVGSGKTIVALRAMLTVVDSGGQAALLAPTEVLAQQHARSIRAMLGPLAEGGLLGGADRGTRVALLTGSQPTAARRQALLDVASGAAGIVVGTHALLQENVSFFDLGLVVVDEQHRFGVEQRDALRGKAEHPPHVLVMTATPIPRTVAMTVFGDLEVSTLRELPRGRSPISSHVVPVGEKPHFLERAWARVREEAAAGHQAYVVCPRIGEAAAGAGAGSSAEKDEEEPTGDEPDDTGRRPPLAVLDVAPMLAEGPLSGLRLDVLHGKLPPEAKDDVMRRFAAGEVDVLVATTVVEVGVDVPNSTAMVVMDADRFGVSQLHQLRGRVGRGSAPGICLLVTDAEAGTPARERLDAVASTLDGFELSRIDLEQRREGDVLGATQSGKRSSLRALSVVRDEEVIRAAREQAVAVVEADPELAAHPALRSAVRELLDAERADYLEKA